LLNRTTRGVTLTEAGAQLVAQLRNAFDDIDAAGFDAGIRFGEHLAQDKIAMRIGAGLPSFRDAMSLVDDPVRNT